MMEEKSVGSCPTAGIVTFHKSLSYGGCLQAYATYLLLQGFGYETFFVDYENPYEARMKSNAVFRYGTFRERLAAFVKKSVYHQEEFQKRAFESFHRALPVTPRSYDNAADMDEVSADVLLVASDQVWNPKITGSIDPAFFLDFGVAERRLSLASSMGSYKLSQDEAVICGKHLERFHSVSVREEFAREQIQDLCHCDVHVALDPTLQIEAERWREYETEPKLDVSDGFILVFMVSSSPSRYEKILSALRARWGIPVVMVRLNSKRVAGVDHIIRATPFELLWLIDNATFVLTDSFHGIAFCSNLETPFAALPNISNNVRLEELLTSMELEDCMIDEADLGTLALNGVTFEGARAVLDKRRSEDARWLAAALGKADGSAQC